MRKWIQISQTERPNPPKKRQRTNCHVRPSVFTPLGLSDQIAANCILPCSRRCARSASLRRPKAGSQFERTSRSVLVSSTQQRRQPCSRQEEWTRWRPAGLPRVYWAGSSLVSSPRSPSTWRSMQSPVIAAPVLVIINIGFSRYTKMHAARSPCSTSILYQTLVGEPCPRACPSTRLHCHKRPMTSMRAG
ncbi:hypothetical protein V1278_005584 [Bradyrhizobium sp. AZCC 1577]